MSLPKILPTFNEVIQTTVDLGNKTLGDTVSELEKRAQNAANSVVAALGEVVNDIGVEVQALIEKLKSYGKEATDKFQHLIDAFAILKSKFSALLSSTLR